MEGLLMICRGAMVPCIMLALGGNLVGGGLHLSPILCGVSCHFFPSFYHFDKRILCKFAFICHQVICRKFVHDTALVFLITSFTRNKCFGNFLQDLEVQSWAYAQPWP